MLGLPVNVMEDCLNPQPDWTRPGWFEKASAWVSVRLLELDAELQSPVEQIRPHLLKAKTTRGEYYLKAPEFPNFSTSEGRITQALGERFPNYVPQVVAIEETSGWFLMAAFGEALEPDSPFREKAINNFAHIQVGCARQASWLLSAGCVDRRLETLVNGLDDLIATTANHSLLTDGELAKLADGRSALEDRLDLLGAFELPMTIGHGDPQWQNVARGMHHPETFVFHDWLGASVSHPFACMHTFTMAFALTLNLKVPYDNAKELRQRYLARWADYLPENRLLEAWNLVVPFMALYQATISREIVLSEGRAELGPGLRGWRGCLQLLPALLAS